jgi:hypothetical protein
MVCSAIIPWASRLRKTVFSQINNSIRKGEEDIFVSSDLSSLKKKDGELSLSHFGSDNLSIDSKLSVDTCINCNDEDILM